MGPRQGERGVSWRNVCLTLASFVFYAWGEPKWVVPLFILAWINYMIGKRLEKGRKHTLLWLWFGVVFDLGVLAYVKYGAWLGNCGIEFLQLLGHMPADAALFVPMALPLGVSFFTFQAMSYLVDIYRGDVPPARTYVNFSCYLTMFSQLVAGPIVRYADIAGDITEQRGNADMFYTGVRRFVLGLGKKILVANQVAMLADMCFTLDSADLSTPIAWVGILAYAAQIYFDFSAYSDMAIGLGLMFGFRFLENFRHPYSALSMQDFWRRWHISLSSWFRDYVYIPLGGNRGSTARTYINLVLVFFLCGLWHGAALNFVLWGLWHGAFLVVERAGLHRLLAKLPSLLRRVYVWLGFLGGWVLFRADDMDHVGVYFRALLGVGAEENKLLLLFAQNSPLSLLILAAALVGSLGIPAKAYVFLRDYAAARGRGSELCMEGGTILFGLCLLVMSSSLVLAGSYNPFIYFRF